MATGPRLHPKGVRSDAHFWVPRPCQRVCWRPLAVTGLGVPLERSTSFWLCGVPRKYSTARDMSRRDHGRFATSWRPPALHSTPHLCPSSCSAAWRAREDSVQGGLRIAC